MEITNVEPEWSDTDADHLRAFLGTQSGQRLLPRLAQMRPGLLPKGDINEILIRSGEVRAWQAVMEQILFMTRPEPKQQQAEESYPNLDDDLKWSDGQKLDKPTSPTEPTQ
jgi:hypothetical protein